ncbi:glycine--tRNA ligase [Candidatus Kaiserbacteria bacterium RIFCSPHIGHO2_02_FULL_59_21]|uniref:Glycine--tRNA ligase n=1 Tax=Candidatus Kaiserbacteria bacterium RIFCSPHIGHO2_02_FULL_59_21 TaxID=1798500 RepID=A0A1F6E082_9BACT|nr:MAG: glycine--tRNA ligase [Candidatus Kaiserbacteria bacterium RIFCSPHIGHO2_01_FULL_58_22]OGG67068.1 MAG: glycine--tRNA ligase [Candidatus Kaiserbacteria bacterium RIFCSPHIGHO2_02_FULL_59_21]OGG86832.1 MAG: glycine--tRNA ligase [Candidatus Kaiserbacteria bacterium RIFCSPLOWO2_02_FULL_59_19]
MEKIVSLCKRRGFIYPGSEIYGGLSGTWDYGPLGVELKNNVKNLWWRMFVQERDDMYGMDAAILMNPKAWEASGHVAGFTDPLSDGSKFNTMFRTSVGAGAEAAVSYLRPETAGGIFVNFKNVVDSFHPKLPFGIAQIGKAFRNEIAPRDFLFRVREMEQMEIEYFVQPHAWEKSFEEWRQAMYRYIEAVGIARTAVHELEVPEDERAHYSKRTIDFEFDFPFGRKELCGLAYRTDFDLSAHAKSSGTDLSYLDEETKERFVPHVIEPSLGVDRAILALLVSAYTEDELGGETRTYLKFNPSVAPIKAAVFPLLKNKPALVSKAREVYALLKADICKLKAVAWDDNGNIGKRYRRQDEIGTPACITVDFQTLEDGTVTLRDRDTGAQERVAVSELTGRIAA